MLATRYFQRGSRSVSVLGYRSISSSFVTRNNELQTVKDYNKKMMEYVKDGFGTPAIKLFREMKEKNIQPNQNSYHVVAAAATCSEIAFERAKPYLMEANELGISFFNPKQQKALGMDGIDPRSELIETLNAEKNVLLKKKEKKTKDTNS